VAAGREGGWCARAAEEEDGGEEHGAAVRAPAVSWETAGGRRCGGV
jgi:hypothetical protein